MKEEIMHQSALTVTVLLAAACGRGDSSGLPPRGTLHVLRGAVTTESGTMPASLAIKATAVDPNPNGAFRSGNCVGSKMSDASGATSHSGSFLLDIPSSPTEDTLCVVVQVSRSNTIVATETVPSAFFRGANAPPDTSTVAIRITG